MSPDIDNLHIDTGPVARKRTYECNEGKKTKQKKAGQRALQGAGQGSFTPLPRQLEGPGYQIQGGVNGF